MLKLEDFKEFEIQKFDGNILYKISGGRIDKTTYTDINGNNPGNDTFNTETKITD